MDDKNIKKNNKKKIKKNKCTGKQKNTEKPRKSRKKTEKHRKKIKKNVDDVTTARNFPCEGGGRGGYFWLLTRFYTQLVITRYNNLRYCIFFVYYSQQVFVLYCCNSLILNYLQTLKNN